MRKLVSAIFALSILSLLAACGEEEEQISTPPTFEGITVEERSPVQDGDQDPYAVPKNGDITLEIQFDNPDNVEFNSVQINGTTYRAHRFSEDSTSENLILNLGAGRIPGETLYEIEEIEYIDEEGVKSVAVDEGNAYTLFVMRSEPEAMFDEISVSNNTIDFELTIEDSDDTLTDARLELVHEEDGVMEEKDVESGITTHELTKLLSDTAYSLRVVASFETDDPEVSDGLVEDEVIGEYTDIETDAQEEPSVDIVNSSVGETTYGFDLDHSNLEETIEDDVLTIEIRQDDNLITDKEVGIDDLEGIEFDDLLSNNTYTVEVYGNYNLKDGEGLREDVLLASREFTTAEKELSAIDTAVESVDENGFKLAIDTAAFKETAEIEHMLLYVYEGDVESFDEDDDSYLKKAKLSSSQETFKFDGLHADQDITVFVVPSYRLDDGRDWRSDESYREAIETPSNQEPTVTIGDVALSQEGAEVSLDVDDPDSTLVEGSYTYYLYEYDGDKEEEVRKLEDRDETSLLIPYDNIRSDKSYRVEVEADYDLRDGEDAHEGIKMDTAYTTASLHDKAPSITINDISADEDSITLDYTILDNDDTIDTESDGIILKVGDTSHTLDELSDSYTIEDLNADTAYDIAFELTYDLGDGEGERTSTLSSDATTDALSEPTLEITETDALNEGLEYTLDLDDPDAIARFESARVLKDGDEVRTVDEGEALSGLQSDTGYTFEVTYTYDLNDGTGEKTLTETHDFKTDAYTAPTVEITDIETARDGFRFDYTFTDPDGVLDEDSLTFAYDSTETSVEDLSGTIEKTDLMSDTEYVLTLEAAYDLNDGEGEQTLTASETLTTNERSSATATSEGSDSTPGVSTFDFTIDDPDGTIVDDTLEAELTDESGDVLEEWSLNASDTTLTHYGLIYDETLTLTLTAAIDRHDGEDAETTTLLETTLDVPEYVTYEEDTLDEDSFEGTIDLSELEGILDFDTLEHSLRYVYSDEVVGEATMSNKALTYNVNGLLADREIELAISGSYDLGDGNESGEIYSTIIKTESNSVPSAEIDIEEFDVEDGSIDFLAPIVDRDEVRFEDSTVAILYRENSLGEMEYVTEMVLEDALFDIEDVYEIDKEEREIAVETGTDVETLLDSLDGDDLFVDDDTEILENDRETVKDNDAVINNDDYLKVVDQNENVTFYRLLVEHEFYSFEDLDLDYQDYYRIEIETDYYLRDGRGNHEDVNIGNDTVLIDVTPDAPDATIANVSLSKGGMTFDADVEDRHETIQDESLYAVLYKDGDEVERQALDSLNETPTFKELENNHEYTVDIIADVDLKEASIREDEVLDTHTFTSYDAAPDVTTDLSSDKGEVTADIDITDADDTIDRDTLEAVLYDDGEEVARQTLDSLDETVTFDELKNNTAYTLEIIADVDYDEASTRDDEVLDTDTVSTPDVEAGIGFSTDRVNEHRIDLRISIDDAYDTISGSEGTVHVYDEEDKLVTEFEDVSDGNELSLVSLDADHEYTYVFEADTDYLDGQGTTTRILGETTVKTEAYETPEADVTMDDVTHDDADFTVALDNPDSLTADITAIDLYQDGSKVDDIGSPDEGAFTWSDLASDTTYAIEVTFEYDMQDGNGTQTDTVSETFTTDAYTQPDASIENVAADEDSVDFTVDESDPDNRGSIDAIELLMDDEVKKDIASPSAGAHDFSDLYSDQDYTLRVTYTYDLDDGEGEQTITVTESFTTDALTEPAITIDDQAITGDAIEVELSALNDPDDTAGEMTLELWYDGELKDQHNDVSGDSAYTFDDAVEPDTEYTIILRADVDLGDSDSPYEDEILDQVKIRNLS